MNERAVIITDDPGWHGKRLREAFLRHGVAAEYVSAMACRLQISTDRSCVVMPGFDGELPDVVFVRGVPGGSLEQVVYHLNLLHAMQANGVLVYNDGRAIERSVDKCFTSFTLANAGMPTPQTWVSSNRDEVVAIVRAHASERSPLVCKPLFGSQGKGLCLVTGLDSLPDASEVQGVWYLQTFIGEFGRGASDWRVFVIAGQAVAAMRRTASGWLTNVAQGGDCQAALPEGVLRDLAERATGCLEMDYAGVDLMRDNAGRWWVTEVNSIPAWRALQKVTAVDIADSLVSDLMRRCRASGLSEVVS